MDLKSKQIKMIACIFKKLSKRSVTGGARYVTDREIGKSYADLFGSDEGVRDFMLMLNDRRHILENKKQAARRFIHAWRYGCGIDRMVFLTVSQDFIEKPWDEVMNTVKDIIEANMMLKNEDSGRH